MSGGDARLAVKVRRAKGRDLEEYAKRLQSVADEGRYLFTETVTEEMKKSLARLFKDKGALAIVAEVGGKRKKIVGSLTLIRYGHVKKASHVRVLGMLVIKEYRGLGIGTKLIVYALEWVKSHEEIEKIILGVFSNNRKALRLYEKFGFEVEGIKKRQYYIAGKHEDEIEMALFLKRPSS